MYHCMRRWHNDKEHSYINFIYRFNKTELKIRCNESKDWWFLHDYSRVSHVFGTWLRIRSTETEFKNCIAELYGDICHCSLKISHAQTWYIFSAR